MLDPITEAISHFIGYFHLASEEMRLRLKYEQFRTEKAEQDEIRTHDPTLRELPTYELDGYDPDLSWKPKPDDGRFSSDPGDPPWPEGLGDLPGPTPFPEPTQDFLPPTREAMLAAIEPPLPELHLTLPPPPSVATVTLQANMLQDDDVLGDVAGAGFAPPESFAPRLDHLEQVAEDLTIARLPHPESDTPWVEVAEALTARIEDAAGGDGSLPLGAVEFTATGAAASGILVDGQVADAMPTLADEMPAFFEAPEEETDDPSKDFPDGYEAPEAQPSGHLVVTGANVAVNETQVTASWLDAPVIVVAGDVTRIDLIDQVNSLSDNDDLGSTAAPELPSDLLNAAMIEVASAPADGGGTDPSEPFPSNWVVTELTGDLVCYNWVSQTSYVTDHDSVVLTSMGSNTYVSLGENGISNTTLIAELGSQYDLIVVGGNMYDISAIYQRNVLLDDDLVIGGEASGGDNLLYNGASIETAGTDTYGKLTAPYEEALAAAAGSGSMPASLSQEELLQGSETLNVLYISGDFVTVNVVEQVNVLGDSDQVEIAAQAAMQAAGKGVEVVTGSNVLANTAAIHEFGVDSTIMAGGAIYTDALIHQAGFVNPEAPPTGVAMPGLASEAVAFLADDMIDAPAGADPGVAGPPPMDGGSLDVMQTMLA